MQKEQCCENNCDQNPKSCDHCYETICQKWLPMIRCNGHDNCNIEMCSECWRDLSIVFECDICKETYTCCNLDEANDIIHLLPSALSFVCNLCLKKRDAAR